MNDILNTDVLGFYFNDLYEPQAITLALADLISKNDKDKPIIAAHSYGYNNIKCIPDTLISQEEREKVFNLGKLESNDLLIQKKWAEISKNKITEEFDAIFALLEKHKCPVTYIRWMPKDDEIYASARPNPKGHYVCLCFFYDHNHKKSILIANPNGREIQDEHEADVINSYLKKNQEVNIYQSQDYTQFNNITCGPGALVLLRMLYNMSEQELKGVLEKGEKKTFRGNNQFNFTTIKLGDYALQKEIGKIPQKNTLEEKDVDQKLRLADYNNAELCKKNNVEALFDDNFSRFTFDHVECNQELVKDLPKDQATLLNKLLLSGKQLLTPEQIPQAQQNRKEILGIQEKRAEKSEFSKILAATVAFAAVALLCSAIFIDMKKEFKIGGIALSSVMLISAITCFFLPGKTLDSKLCVNLTNPKIETTPILQQLPQK